MKRNEHGLQEVLKRFESLLKQYPDKLESLHFFKTFIKGVLRVKSTTTNMPIAEFMSIIKHERPLVFKLLKQQSSNDSYLKFLTEINMNNKAANNNISKLKEQITSPNLFNN